MGEAPRPHDAAGLAGVVVGVVCVSMRTVDHPGVTGTTELPRAGRTPGNGVLPRAERIRPE